MNKTKSYLLGLLILIFALSLAIPVPAQAAGRKVGVILGDNDYSFSMADNLTVTSPAGNLMVKAYSVCKKLGLTYSYDTAARKLTIKNPNNGKTLVFKMGKKTFIYYPDPASEGYVKSSAYKLYYDTASKSYVIHMSTLKYLVNYNYYNNLKGTYYPEMGYSTVIAYSIFGYSSYDIPVAEEVIDYINSKTFTAKDDLLDAVRMNMIAHKTLIVLKTNREVVEELGPHSVYKRVMAIDSKNTAKDADYLLSLIDKFEQRWQVSYTIVTKNGVEEEIHSPEDPVTLTINVQYETTLTEERVVDNRIADILKDLKLKDASDYEKVKIIHDYIINLVSYDTTLMKFSVYDILMNKTAICQGYALTAYRLLTDAGLECKIISGTGNGGRHAWNIVKVDGVWYNIDLTWDDPITYDGKPVLRYDYFLKSDGDFKDHIRDAEFRTQEFMNTYPIAEESYPM